MGKKRTQKDRLYLTATEHQQSDRGYKDPTTASSSLPVNVTTALQQQATPFDRCALTLREWKKDAVCTTVHGYYCFDLLALVPYLTKERKHPILKTPLTIKDLIKLHFATNNEEQYVDAVTMQPFTQQSHIVAIRPSGNVYLYDTIHELCIKAKAMYDLIDNKPFRYGLVLWRHSSFSLHLVSKPALLRLIKLSSHLR